MSVNEERESFGAALQDTALTFDLPPSADLYEGAVQRGGRIKRRRAIGVGATAGVALAVAGVLAATLVGSGAASSHPAVPVTSVSNAGLGKYMADNLGALLPAGATLNIGTGTTTLTGNGYEMRGNDGEWEADADAFAVYHGEQYTFDFSIIHQHANWNCSSPDMNLGPCTSKQVGDGALVSGSNDLPNVPQTFYYYWDLAGGKAVELRLNPNLADKNPVNPFTEQQMQALVTAPAWTSVLKGLPAIVDCPDLEPVNQGASGWKCSTTGKVYPATTDEYVAFS